MDAFVNICWSLGCQIIYTTFIDFVSCKRLFVMYFTWLVSFLCFFFFTFSDDLEYERAFAALDELNLARLKPFFKKEFLQVINVELYFNCFPLFM